MRNVAFTRWDPLRDLLALHEQIGQLVGTDAPGWTPPVDLYETAGRVRPHRRTPGPLARPDRDSRRRQPHHDPRRARRRRRGADVPCEQYHRVERGHGRFSRAFVLPEPIDVGRDHRRSEGRPPHGHDSEGQRPRRAPHRRDIARRLMIRRFFCPCALVVAGFVAGLVAHRPACARQPTRAPPMRRRVAGARAARAVTRRRAGRAARRRRRRSPSAGPTSRASPARPSRASPTSRRCRSCARRTRRSRNDPFFRYFFGDDDAFGSRDRRSLSLGSGVDHLRRRLRRHQQPRRRRERARDHGRAARQARDARARSIGTDPATDIALLKIDVDRPAGRAVGRFEPAEGRRMGAGDRQPVPAEPDGDRRHRQRHRPRRTSASPTTRTSSRPTRRSTRATRAAR